jgi:hypothetical protein
MNFDGRRFTWERLRNVENGLIRLAKCELRTADVLLMASGWDAMDNAFQTNAFPSCLHVAYGRSHFYPRPIADRITITDDAIAVGTMCPSLSITLAPIASSIIWTSESAFLHVSVFSPH